MIRIIEKYTVVALLMITPLSVLADRYGLNEPGDIETSYADYGVLGDIFSGVIGLIFGVAPPYLFLLFSYLGWKKRRANKQKPEPLDGIGVWLFVLTGYLIAGFLISLPFSLLFNSSNDGFLFNIIIGFAVITYLRRT